MDVPGSISDNEDTWITFHEPSPALVRARFNITQIEVPTDDLEDENTPELLQMLIKEGIPVKVVPTEDAEESNAGVIMHQPCLEATSETDIVMVTGGKDEDNDSTSALLSSIPNIENAIEVTGVDKPISKPLFLHYAPTLPESPKNKRNELEKSIFKRRVSISMNADGPILPRMDGSPTGLPVKKSVRFNLPERKGSLIGVYEYFPIPSKSSLRSKTGKQRTKPAINGRKNEAQPNGGKIKNKTQNRDQRNSNAEIDTDLQIKLDNYCLEVDMSSCNGSRDGLDSSESDSRLSPDSDDDLSDGNEDREHIRRTCGIGRCRPKWMQKYAKKEVYFVIFCTISLLQGMLYAYSNSVISTLEKRFLLSRRSTGIILAGADLSQVLFAILIGFYGSRYHITRLMGIGGVLAGSASLLAAFPHFIYGGGDQAESLQASKDLPFGGIKSIKSNTELCGRVKPDECSSSQEEMDSYGSVALVMFMSQFILGISSSIFWTVGLSLLDDSVRKTKAPLYLTVFTIVRVVGPTLGFLLGGYCLSLWIDPQQMMNLSPRDPRWLGAWWLGFVMLSACLTLTGVVYFCFPRNLPWQHVPETLQFLNHNTIKEPRDLKVPLKSVSGSDTKTSMEESFKKLPPVGDFLGSLKRLFGNTIWMANLFSNIMFVLAFSGYWKFKPKYIEHQFRKSASAANFYTGMSTMVASVFGIGMSGIILRWGRPRPKFVTGYNVVLSVFAVASLFVLMSIHCAPIEFAGHVPQKETWACAKHCKCSEEFHPVCAEDGRTVFYSPCYAGCSSVNVLLSPKEFANCSCIGRVKWMKSGTSNDIEMMSPTLEEGWAVEGYCPEECKSFIFFISFQVFMKMVFSTGRVGGTLINLRAVEDKDKAVALGCMTTLITLLGFVPATFFTENVIDSACSVWQEKCGKKGDCWFYDSARFRLLMHMVPAGLLIFSGIGDLVVHLNHTKLDLYGTNESSYPLQDISSQKSCLRQPGRSRQASSRI